LRKTGIVKDKRYLKHKAGFSHPESPERLASVYEILESPSCARHYVRIEPRAALPEEIAYVHTPHYIDFVSSTSGKSHVILDSDTITSADTYKIALLAAGGLLNAIDAVIAALPALKKPTISRLAGIDYYSVQTVVDKATVNTLIPGLKAAGAEDILEIPISKIVR